MNHSIRAGFSFGLTSGIITTLGLIVGLHAGTHSRLVVIGGILTIAIADAFSDALGMHISRESEQKHSTKQVWEATVATFLAKLLFALTFLVPVLLLELSTAIIVSVAWGLLVLGFVSYRMAIAQKARPHSVIGEHLFIATMVIIITHYVGEIIAVLFSGM
jgi:VIT1/CCC1 family predicted Fe2+/Mn2+ transporter